MLVLPVACSCGALYWFEVHFVSRHLHSKKKEREVEEERRERRSGTKRGRQRKKQQHPCATFPNRKGT